MHGNQLVMWVALAVAVGIPVLILRRKRKVLTGFDDLVAERNFVARTSSPVAAFAQANPPDGMHFSKAYDGALRPGVAMSLLMLRRSESIIINGVSVPNQTIYVGIYVPAQPPVTPAFQKTWTDNATGKRADVVYAAPAAEGGFVIVWKGAPSRANVEARLNAVAQSIP
jgi:hypothetical protein